MSVEFPQVGEIFSLRSYKRLVSAPTVTWANSYEFRMLGGAGVTEQLDTLAQVVVDWEQLFHLPAVEFDRVVISTYVEDGQPYNPASFKSVDFTGKTGARNPDGADLMPLEVALLVRRGVQFGRNGRALYRGVLTEVDVTSFAGKAAITPARLAALADLMIIDGENLNDLAAAVLFNQVMKGSSAQDVVRLVGSNNPVGVTVKKLNNRYFDRA